MIGLNRRALLFAFNTYAASMLALFIAFSLDLPRPFWAMITAFITSQPFSGAVRSKAVYRICGTLTGSLAALLMVPALVDAPELLTLALGLWLALCLGISLLDRTPRSYGFMLAGYTAALVGFPSVLAPDQIFQTAVARAEEISLGALCASLFHGLIFPVDLLPKLVADLNNMLRDAESWTADTLARLGGEVLGRDRRKLASDTTELFLNATHLSFELGADRDAQRAVAAMQDRLVAMLPLLAAVSDRLMALEEVPPALEALLEGVRGWLAPAVREVEISRVHAAELIRAVREQAGRIEGRDWQSMIATNFYLRLVEVIEVVEDCRELTAYLDRPDRPAPPRLAGLLAAAPNRELHRDPLIAWRSGIAALLAVVGSGAFWIVTAWPDGAACTMLAGTYLCLFCTKDDPRPQLRVMALYILLSVPVSAFYVFGVLPAIDGFPMLAAALAPCLLAIGYFMAIPATAPRAMGVMMGFIGGLALQSAYNADFAVFLNSNVAQLVGAFIALVVLSLSRVIGAAAAARRLVRLAARDLAALAGGRAGVGARKLPSLNAWVSRMVDREGLLQQRLALVEEDPELAGADLLGDLRAGANILTLARVRRSFGAEPAIADLFAALARYFTARARGRAGDADALIGSIDRSLGVIAGGDCGRPDHNDGIAALVGLRRSLFPQAPGYRAAQVAP